MKWRDGGGDILVVRRHIIGPIGGCAPHMCATPKSWAQVPPGPVGAQALDLALALPLGLGLAGSSAAEFV